MPRKKTPEKPRIRVDVTLNETAGRLMADNVQKLHKFKMDLKEALTNHIVATMGSRFRRAVDMYVIQIVNSQDG